ncbi:PAS domain-containing protein [Flavihumibacter sp. R14]|nr:PAS domain-containing protein [Flavihumibacter soli]
MQFTDETDLHNTVLNAPIGICILNAETLVAEIVNDKFLEVAGKPYDTIFGKFYWDAFAEARAYYEAALSGVVASGEAYYADEVELMLIRHGREERIFVTFVYAPIKNKADQITKVAVWVLENTKQVTERQKEIAAKVAFQQERDRFKSFFMQAPAGICILRGPQLIYELVNPAYQQLLPGRNLLNRPIFEALPELIGTPLQEILINVYHNGEPYEMNELLIPIAEYEDGPTQDRYFSFSYQPWRNENGQVDGILAIVFDVSAMIDVQHELREAREKSDQQKRVYETITSGTPDLMYVWDLNYRFTYANSALLTMWGKTWDTAIGKSLLENGYEPWHAEMHELEIDWVRLNKQPVRGEVAFPHAILGKRIYDYILIPVLNENGEVEAVAGTTRDVTERKQMEQALAESSEELQAINEELAEANEKHMAANEKLIAANEELQSVNQQLLAARQKIEESEVALRLAISAANFGTWYLQSVTREFITDARLKELFGYYPDEDLSIEQALAQITEEYRGFVAEKLEKAIYEHGDYDVTYPVVGLHDNRMRWLRAIGNLKADPSGDFSAFTGVVMDITEQMEDEQRKNDFIGMVSHELKTPLTTLSAIIQVANSKLNHSENSFLAGAMEKANLQVNRMGTMINGFLNVSRLASAKLLLEKKDFRLDQLIEEIIKETALTAPAHVLHFQPCDDSIIVEADHDKIGSVITNLVSNAAKYSPKGKAIEVVCKKMDGKALVSVKDEGMGIQSQDKEKIFERYFRVESNTTQHISGFGIGLYLSAEIIRAHHGDIWVESESGKGSTFYFSLPISSEDKVKSP